MLCFQVVDEIEQEAKNHWTKYQQALFHSSPEIMTTVNEANFCAFLYLSSRHCFRTINAITGRIYETHGNRMEIFNHPTHGIRTSICSILWLTANLQTPFKYTPYYLFTSTISYLHKVFCSEWTTDKIPWMVCFHAVEFYNHNKIMSSATQ